MTPQQVAAAIGKTTDRMSAVMKPAIREALADAGREARKNLLRTATIVPGGDRKFSHWRAPALAVKTRQVENGTLIVSPKGPWKVAEVGAAPHGGHPGTASTQGRKAWSQGREATFSTVQREFPQAIEERVADAFEGG